MSGALEHRDGRLETAVAAKSHGWRGVKARLEPGKYRLCAIGGRRRLLSAYNFKYSRSRRVCDLLTGISVAAVSFILRM